MNSSCTAVACSFLLSLVLPHANAAEPASDPLAAREVNVEKIAFSPEKWRQSQVDFSMLSWEGSRVVFIARQGAYDAKTMTDFVKRLDAGWIVYSSIIGAQPRPLKRLQGKPTICALPKPNLSCGYGCGYVGATGIEVAGFYNTDWNEFRRDPTSFRHYYFYEMGRNFFVFGDRHSLFTTGYGVFMRYVCMDQLKCKDNDLQTRETIERCESIYAKSKVSFYDAFTNLGAGEKANRLRDAQGKLIRPSDQPVMYATAMLKLRRDHGGDEWTKRFYHALRLCKPYRAKDIASARPQCYNWLVCASTAANKDLTSVFVDRWRMPLTAAQREVMSQTNWGGGEVVVAAVVQKLIDSQ